MSCAGCPFFSALWVELEYFKCRRCGNVWLDDPLDVDAWRCPSCNAEDVELLKGSGGSETRSGSR